ncbi:MAG: gluconeogenesis factor YvcK family protein [Ferrimicrobium sp.]
MTLFTRTVVIGGGHGLAASIQAAASLSQQVSVIVGVADDGGSTGRLREEYWVPAVGDLRRTLSNCTDPESLSYRLLEYRFIGGTLDGHALGNLLLVALRDLTGSLEQAVQTVQNWIGLSHEVIPASEGQLRLVGTDLLGRVISGQYALHVTRGIDRIWLEPRDHVGSPSALRAIRDADLILLGPGSLYTSVLATLMTNGLADAVLAASAPVVFIQNLRPQDSETAEFTSLDHLQALARHGVTPDLVIADSRFLTDDPSRSDSSLAQSEPPILERPVGQPGGRVHDIEALAHALEEAAAILLGDSVGESALRDRGDTVKR